MKLAEALIERADLQRHIEQLKSRAVQNAKVQEGSTPAEDPNALLGELDRAATQLTGLIQRINRTNAATSLDDGGLTIADAIAERDVLKLRHAAYKSLADAGVVEQNRYSKSEVRFESLVNVAALQARADDVARAYRELDTRIQAANWATDLLE